MNIATAVALIVLMALGGIFGDMALAGSTSLDSQYLEDVNIVSHWGVVSSDQTFGVLEYAKAPVEMLGALFRLATLDPACFGGPWGLIRLVLFAPILAAIAAVIVWGSLTILDRVIS